MITGLNHITIAVSDLEVSLHFYSKILDCRPHARWNAGAYLSAGNLWICLSLNEASPANDYSHIAFSIPGGSFDKFANRVVDANVKTWKTNESEGDSLYILDPDGHKLELHVGDLASRLQAVDKEPYAGWVRLDGADA